MWALLASSFIHQSLHLFDFCKKSCLKILAYALFFSLLSKNCYMMPPYICGWCVILARALTNGIQQLVHFCSVSLSLPHRKALEESYVQTKLKGTIPRKFPDYTGGYFKFNTYQIIALGWLKGERKKERKMNSSDFWRFLVCHFKIVATHCYYYCRLRQALCTFWC